MKDFIEKAKKNQEEIDFLWAKNSKPSMSKWYGNKIFKKSVTKRYDFEKKNYKIEMFFYVWVEKT